MGEAGLARTFDTIKETTGLDLVGLINDTMSTKQGNKELVQVVSESTGSHQPTTDPIE
jgi:flotillin